MNEESFSTLLLAAGKATRFKSDRSKLLHGLAGRPLGEYLLRTAIAAGPERAYIVIGHGGEEVRATFARPGLIFIEQQEQLGTGHALIIAREELERCPSAMLVVLVGDAPLLRADTIRRLVKAHQQAQVAATILTTVMEDPTGYGRILRAATASDRLTVLGRGMVEGAEATSDSAGIEPAAPVIAIVEQKICTPEQRKIREISSGILCFSRLKLLERLGELTADNAQREYLLTDLVEIFNRHGECVATFPVTDQLEIQGVNDRVDLARVGKILRQRKAESLMREGITIVDPEATYIDQDVEVLPDTIIEPGASLLGSSRVGRGCLIGPYATIINSILGDRTVVRQASLIVNSEIAAGGSAGPFAHVREGSLVEPGARIGNFVEVKKSRIGPGSKALHLTYLGDAILEQNVNIGAGTVTCNYDGMKKYPTTIEQGAFIGSGTMLVAPVRVGKHSYVAAGSTITEDVPPESLALGRARQANKEGWVRAKREKEGGGQTVLGSRDPVGGGEARSGENIESIERPDVQTMLPGGIPKNRPTAAESATPMAVGNTELSGKSSVAPVANRRNDKVTVREVGSATVFEVSGRLTRGELAAELREKIHEAVVSGRRRLVIDMAKVMFLDSAGIGELIGAANELRTVGGELKLSGLPGKLRHSLTATNLDRALDIRADEAEALASFSKPS